MIERILRKCFYAAVAVVASSIMLPAVGRVCSWDSGAKTPSDSISRNDSRLYDYLFIEAVRQQNAGNYASALDLLNRCIEIKPDAAEAYYLRATYFGVLNNDKQALADIERAAKLSPGNDYYQEKVAQYYIGTKDYQRAIDAYERLYDNHRDRSDVLNILQQLYRQQKNYAGMLSAVERMEKVDGESDETTMAKMNIYEMKGEKQKARAQLQHLVDIHPNDATYKVMLGNWLLQNSEKQEAYNMFKTALENDPESETAQSSMYDYYVSTGQDSLAAVVRDQVLMNKKVSTKTRISMLMSVISENEKNGGDSTAVMKVLDDILAADPSNADMAYVKASYMEKEDMPKAQIEAAYAHVVDLSPDNVSARIRLIDYQWMQERWDDMINTCTAAVEYNPEEMMFYYFLGIAYYQKKNEDAALDALKRGVGEINDDSDPDMVSDFYAMMGDILYNKKQPEAAFAAYDSCLQWKEDNIVALNNYAYYLSEMGLDLRKAEQMSYKAVKEEPNNSTYLDTYAWILYMQDRNDEAKVYIEQALAVDTDTVVSATVLEHAGDIYAVNGNRNKAEEMWQKAIDAGGDKVALRKKINKKTFEKKTKKR